MNIFIRWLINAVTIFVAAYILPGVEISSFGAALIVALVLAVVNVMVKPLLIVLTLPATILSLGLFLFVINALMVLLVDRLVDGFHVSGFWWALLFSVCLSILNAVLKETSKPRSQYQQNLS